MELHFLRVVDAGEDESSKQLRDSVGLWCTLVDKPLPLTESLMSRKTSEFSKISQV